MYQTTWRLAAHPHVNQRLVPPAGNEPVHCTPVHIPVLPGRCSIENVESTFEPDHLSSQVLDRDPVGAVIRVGALDGHFPRQLRAARTRGQWHDGPEHVTARRPPEGEPAALGVRLDGPE